MSISEPASVPGKEAFSFPIAARSALAIGLEDGYVSVMTWVRRSWERCFRMDEMERRTRRVNRASNCDTARSSRTKFALISEGKGQRLREQTQSTA